MPTYPDRHHDEQTRHRLSVEALRRHPLAMDPAAASRAAAASLAASRPTRAQILPFILPADSSEQAAQSVLPVVPGRLEAAARDYLRHPSPPNGYAKQLAETHGVNYGSLLYKICHLRQRERFA